MIKNTDAKPRAVKQFTAPSNFDWPGASADREIAPLVRDQRAVQGYRPCRLEIIGRAHLNQP